MRLSNGLVLCAATITAITCFFAVRGELGRLDATATRLELEANRLRMPAMRIVIADPDDLEPIKNALQVSYLAPKPVPAPAPVPMAIKLSPVQDLIIEDEAPLADGKPQIAAEDAIRMALRQKRAMFEYCFDQELKKQAIFNGYLVIKLSVAVDGRITAARIEEGNRRDRAVGDCIVSQLRTVKLPALAAEADLLLPIRLRASLPVSPEMHAEADVPAGT